MDPLRGLTTWSDDRTHSGPVRPCPPKIMVVCGPVYAVRTPTPLSPRFGSLRLRCLAGNDADAKGGRTRAPTHEQAADRPGTVAMRLSRADRCTALGVAPHSRIIKARPQPVGTVGTLQPQDRRDRAALAPRITASTAARTPNRRRAIMPAGRRGGLPLASPPRARTLASRFPAGPRTPASSGTAAAPDAAPRSRPLKRPTRERPAPPAPSHRYPRNFRRTLARSPGLTTHGRRTPPTSCHLRR